MAQVRFLSAFSLSQELARSAASAGVRYSDDRIALFVPTLRLDSEVLRRVAHGDTLYRQFLGCVLVESFGEDEHTDIRPWSFVWGDLRLFRTGSQLADHCIFMRGAYTRPDLTAVHRYLREFQRGSALRLSVGEESLNAADVVQANGQGPNPVLDD